MLPTGDVLGALAALTSERRAVPPRKKARPIRKQMRRAAPRIPLATPPAEEVVASGPGPRGRADGSLERAQDALTGAVAATTSNALLAPLLLLALGLLTAAGLAPVLAAQRLRPVIEWRGHLAVMGLAFLAAWALVAGVFS